MKNSNLFQLIMILLLSSFLVSFTNEKGDPIVGEHKMNSYYTGRNLDRVAFPIGGIGAGMFCIEGTGAISHLSVKNSPEIFNEPFTFAAISIKGVVNGTKVLEAPIPTWKLFGSPGAGNGSGGKSYG